jgi:hypothetical protein
MTIEWKHKILDLVLFILTKQRGQKYLLFLISIVIFQVLGRREITIL